MVLRGATEHIPMEKTSRSAIIIPNDTIDAIMITQCSDDMVLFELKLGQETFYASSAYMEYNAIENSFK